MPLFCCTGPINWSGTNAQVSNAHHDDDDDDDDDDDKT
jgi:hypothetical protein